MDLWSQLVEPLIVVLHQFVLIFKPLKWYTVEKSNNKNTADVNSVGCRRQILQFPLVNRHSTWNQFTGKWAVGVGCVIIIVVVSMFVAILYWMCSQGLLKARKILEDNFGNVHIHFGEPISIRKYSDGLVDRSLHNLAPRYRMMSVASG